MSSSSERWSCVARCSARGVGRRTAAMGEAAKGAPPPVKKGDGCIADGALQRQNYGIDARGYYSYLRRRRLCIQHFMSSTRNLVLLILLMVLDLDLDLSVKVPRGALHVGTVTADHQPARPAVSSRGG